VIAEAIDTVFTLGWALAAWVAVFAAVASIVLLAGTAVGMWAVRGTWRVLYGRWSASEARNALREGQPTQDAADGHRETRAPADTPRAATEHPQSAPQPPDAPFPTPAAPEPSSARTAPSWAQPDKDAA
jgi:hypothetical protein